MMKCQNYKMTCQRQIVINSRLFQIIKKRKLGNKYDPVDLFLEACNYDVWFESEELSDIPKSDEKSTDLLSMSSLEGDEEEAKKGKGLKIQIPSKLLTRLPISSAKIIKIKSNQHNKITKKVYNNVVKPLQYWNKI